MTDQQPHTPYIEDGWLVEPCEPDYAPGISQPIPGSWSKPIVNLAELDGYDELIAAAEQRRAIKALRDAAGAIEKNQIMTQVGRLQPCNSCMVIHMDFLDYRADLLEGDDE